MKAIANGELFMSEVKRRYFKIFFALTLLSLTWSILNGSHADVLIYYILFVVFLIFTIVRFKKEQVRLPQKHKIIFYIFIYLSFIVGARNGQLFDAFFTPLINGLILWIFWIVGKFAYRKLLQRKIMLK